MRFSGLNSFLTVFVAALLAFAGTLDLARSLLVDVVAIRINFHVDQLSDEASVRVWNALGDWRKKNRLAYGNDFLGIIFQRLSRQN